ncbi:MAG: M23 family metallopeptidase [Acidothermus sp.]|nr:M23 family metallopeptidase [Acidothermus sp.]
MPCRERKRATTLSALVVLACATVSVLGTAASAAHAAEPVTSPLAHVEVIRGFAPPTQPWLAGHRGVDLAARSGEPVLAPADGRIVFVGRIAGRGVVVVQAGELRFTFEPVRATAPSGKGVKRGDPIAVVAQEADHCGPPGTCLHWGVLRADTYLDPLALLARVRLLPIWGAALPEGAARMPVSKEALRSRNETLRSPPSREPTTAVFVRRAASATSRASPGAEPIDHRDVGRHTVQTLAGVSAVGLVITLLRSRRYRS